MNFPLPALGLGTFRLKDQAVIASVSAALELGYRAIDTAQIYGNEAEIGQAWTASGLPREQLALTTKIWTEHLAPERLLPSLRESLDKLRTGHVELTLIHWPSPGGAVPLEATLDALLNAQAQGLTRAIGVSNFPIALLQRAIAHVGAGQLATNQVELHPWLQSPALSAFAARHGVHLTSYMTLGYGQVLQDPTLLTLAAELDATPAQVALAWALQRGHAVIPSSTLREHLASNLLAASLRLSDAQMARIAALDRGQRLVNPEGLAPAWD